MDLVETFDELMEQDSTASAFQAREIDLAFCTISALCGDWWGTFGYISFDDQFTW